MRLNRLSRLPHIALSTLRLHAQIVRRNLLAVLCICAILATILARHAYHTPSQFADYLLAVWLGAFVTDLVVALFPPQTISFPIRHSKLQEALVVLAFTALAFVPWIIRFSRLWPIHNTPARLAFVASLFLFGFFIALACVFLFVYRYRPRELGVNFRYWYLALSIHLTFGVITLLVAPEKSQWQSTIRSDGILGVCIEGIFQAAIPEEFMRLLLFTRLGALLCNNGMGLVIATFLWACIHIPMLWSGSPQVSLAHVLFSTWCLIPIGLLWGYITWRTKSLCPAVLLHGFNLWGLQNL